MNIRKIIAFVLFATPMLHGSLSLEAAKLIEKISPVVTSALKEEMVSKNLKETLDRAKFSIKAVNTYVLAKKEMPQKTVSILKQRLLNKVKEFLPLLYVVKNDLLKIVKESVKLHNGNEKDSLFCEFLTTNFPGSSTVIQESQKGFFDKKITNMSDLKKVAIEFKNLFGDLEDSGLLKK